MGSGMFDGLATGLLAIGAAIGVALCAIGYGVYWLVTHLHITVTP